MAHEDPDMTGLGLIIAHKQCFGIWRIYFLIVLIIWIVRRWPSGLAMCRGVVVEWKPSFLCLYCDLGDSSSLCERLYLRQNNCSLLAWWGRVSLHTVIRRFLKGDRASLLHNFCNRAALDFVLSSKFCDKIFVVRWVWRLGWDWDFQMTSSRRSETLEHTYHSDGLTLSQLKINYQHRQKRKAIEMNMNLYANRDRLTKWKFTQIASSIIKVFLTY